jgi:hypothetical protein
MSGNQSALAGGLFSLLFLAFLLYRQRQVRRVPARVRPRGSAVFLVVGLVVFVGFVNGGTRVPPLAWAILAASFAVGAALGVARAYTVRMWFTERMLMRQGSWSTVGLWLVAVALHVLAGVLIGATGGPRGLESATGMLYLAMSSLVQQVAIVHRGQQRRALARARLAAAEARASGQGEPAADAEQ